MAAMTRLLAPRGPDDEGYWWRAEPGQNDLYCSGADSPSAVKAHCSDWVTCSDIPHRLAFGHRRYAVLAPSAQGHQPMHRGPLTMVYNGELYNYRALRLELEQLGAQFVTDSDTEVVMAAYQQWKTGCFERFRGFFALALYDARQNRLVLARDPLGKAPLYLLQNSEALYFASDIKPLLAACPAERSAVNETAVRQYLCAGLRDAGHQTFWQNIHSLPNGSWLSLAVDSGRIDSGIYWRLPENRQTADQLPFAEALPAFRSLLQQAVQRRLVSDLPLGFTLSGGLDSSALVALYAQTAPAGKVPVFSVRYQNPAEDETPFARMVVKRYAGCLEHHVLDGFEKTLSDEWDTFMFQQEEPFHDPVLYTDFYQQQRLKALGVGVVINGAAADELLAGYPVYLLANLRRLRNQGGWAAWREMAMDMGALYQNTDFVQVSQWLQRRFARRKPAFGQPFLRFEQADDAAPVATFDTLMRQKMSDHTLHYWLRSMHKQYLQVPMEPRLPFLDVDLVDFCMTLPPAHLIQGGWTKYILRKAVENILPPEVVWRKRKMGFPFDTLHWMGVHEAQHKAMLQAGKDNPWVDGPTVARHYRDLLRQQPAFLWRLLCFSVWYYRLL